MAKDLDLTQLGMEKHVKRSFHTAWLLAQKQPINARQALSAAIAVSRDQGSPAFEKLVSLLPLTELQITLPEETTPADLEQIRLNAPLTEAYVVALPFLQQGQRLWGRDYVTFILLALDPSLQEILREAGKDPAEIRDDWFNFVTASTARRDRKTWIHWWHRTGVPLPEERTRTATGKTYLLTWDPDRTEFAVHLARRVEQEGTAVGIWSVGAKGAAVGDRVFFMRHGDAMPGLAGSGRIVSKPREDRHWDEKTPSHYMAVYAHVLWDSLVDLPLVPLKQLIDRTGIEELWTAHGTGFPIEDSTAGLLEELWQTRGHVDPTVVFPEALDPPDREAYLRAVVLHESRLGFSPRVLLACLIEGVGPDTSQGSSRRFIAEWLGKARGSELGTADWVQDLELESLGITTLSVEKKPREIFLSPVTRLIVKAAWKAQSYSARTQKDRILTRHHLAALLAPEFYLVAELTELGVELQSLRSDFYRFIVDKHPKDDLEAWRTILGIPDTFTLRNLITSDTWTYDDHLGYEIYVDAITRHLLDGTTEPPLTIGIQAPWGQGKTTLMKMIQKEIDPDSVHRAPGSVTDLLTQPVTAVFSDLRRWLQSKYRGPFITGTDGKIPTVWFNPLYYHNSKQVWAGMAHAILHQLAAQIDGGKTHRKRQDKDDRKEQGEDDPNKPDHRQEKQDATWRLRQEEFWFRLQLSRINETALRRDAAKAALTHVLPELLFLFAALIAVVLIIFSSFEDLNSWARLGMFLTALLASIVEGHRRYRAWWNKLRLDEKFERYVVEPDYESEMGLLHLVDTDLDRALHLLVGNQRPIAVFVDDLDRCEPKIVAEVVLGINQFLSVQHRKVFFFLGMDMEMVALALQQFKGNKFEGGATSSRARNFGWRFMEKFVQLPFIIPQLEDTQASDFIQHLLQGDGGRTAERPAEPQAAPRARSPEETTPEGGRPGEPPARRPADGQESAPFSAAEEDFFHQEKSAIEALPTVDDAADYAKKLRQRELRPRLLTRIRVEVSRKVGELMADPESDEVERICKLVLKDLELNPRTIKRYLSVARLLRTIHVALGRREQVEADRKLVLRATHLLLSWPELVYWLRGHPELPIGDGSIKPTVATLERTVQGVQGVDEWYDKLDSAWLGDPYPEYLRRFEIFRFLGKISDDPPNLETIFESGLL